MDHNAPSHIRSKRTGAGPWRTACIPQGAACKHPRHVINPRTGSVGGRGRRTRVPAPQNPISSPAPTGWPVAKAVSATPL